MKTTVRLFATLSALFSCWGCATSSLWRDRWEEPKVVEGSHSPILQAYTNESCTKLAVQCRIRYEDYGDEKEDISQWKEDTAWLNLDISAVFMDVHNAKPAEEQYIWGLRIPPPSVVIPAGVDTRSWRLLKAGEGHWFYICDRFVYATVDPYFSRQPKWDLGTFRKIQPYVISADSEVQAEVLGALGSLEDLRSGGEEYSGAFTTRFPEDLGGDLGIVYFTLKGWEYRYPLAPGQKAMAPLCVIFDLATLPLQALALFVFYGFLHRC